ncbi:MAG: translocation/assembly module TamB domain-containing protein, partial [Sediminibacterium sp.]
MLLVFLLLQTEFVQNRIVRFATNKITGEIGTEVKIKHISLSFFNKLDLEGLLIRDKQKDTLVYAGHARVNITDWFFLRKEAELKYVGLEDATIKLQRKDSIWNYQFIADYFSSPNSKKKKTKEGGIQLSLRKIDLKNIHFLQNDLWVGTVNDFKIGALNIDADKIDIANNRFI